MPIGNGSLDLFSEGTNFTAIRGSQGDVEETKAIGHEASHGELFGMCIGRVESLTWGEDGLKARSSNP